MQNGYTVQSAKLLYRVVKTLLLSMELHPISPFLSAIVLSHTVKYDILNSYRL